MGMKRFTIKSVLCDIKRFNLNKRTLRYPIIIGIVKHSFNKYMTHNKVYNFHVILSGHV